MNFIVTDDAWDKLADVLKEKDGKREYLRIAIEGGGCAGMSYIFESTIDREEEDFAWENHGVSVIIDPVSAQYLEGGVLDFKTERFNSQFVISNPNAKTTCGCGSSFVG